VHDDEPLEILEKIFSVNKTGSRDTAVATKAIGNVHTCRPEPEEAKIYGNRKNHFVESLGEVFRTA